MVRIRPPSGWTPVDLVEQIELRELNNDRQPLLYSGDKARRGYAARIPPLKTQVSSVTGGLAAVGALVTKLKERSDFIDQWKKELNPNLDEPVHIPTQNKPSVVQAIPKGKGLKRQPGKGLKKKKEEAKRVGLNPPGYNYLGPGNPNENGPAKNQIDADAKEHDKAYSEAKTSADVAKADSEFIGKSIDHIFTGSNPYDIIGGALGAVGIKAKSAVEKYTGTLYPSVSGNMPVIKDKKKDEYHPYSTDNRKQAAGSASNQAANTPQNPQPSTSKRDPPDEGGRALKASKPEEPVVANADSSVVDNSDIEMGLPGTGKDQAEGGGSSEGQDVFVLPTPISIFGDTRSVYKKTHKFMTFGFAPSIITPSGAANARARVLTTYLAEIPWEKPALYLTPSEFNLLPNGAHAVELSIDVIYRGSTIQFETASSASGLATLNQINDISVAYALNKTGWGSNISYTGFEADEAMIPTAIDRPRYAPITGTYKGMVFDYYGNHQRNPTLFDSYIPHHQMGTPVFLYNYWAITTRTGSNADPAPNWAMYNGWPCLQEKIVQYDGKTTVNMEVASMTYKPKMGYLKEPIKYNPIGLPMPLAGEAGTIPVAGNLVGNRNCTFTRGSQPSPQPEADNGMTASVVESTTPLQSQSYDPLTIYTNIEKSQYSRSGMWGEQDPHIQPSCHIGVQPVPALSSAKLNEEFPQTSFTNVRAYWEVTATMVVSSRTPTAFPFGDTPNVPFGDVIFESGTANIPAINRDPRNDGATLGGLYTLSPAFGSMS